MLTPDRFRPGSDLVAPLNGLRDFFARLAKLEVAPPLELYRDSGGRTIRKSSPAGGWAILSGSSSPYAFAWAHHVGGSTWVAEPASTAGQVAYEVNAAAGLGGTRAFLRPGGVAKQWVFTEARAGTVYVIPGSPCFLCNIPEVPLHLTFYYKNFSGSVVSTTFTLAYHAGPPAQWTSATVTQASLQYDDADTICVPTQHTFELTCGGTHATGPILTHFIDGTGGVGCAQPLVFMNQDPHYSCSPFGFDISVNDPATYAADRRYILSI